jgi:hypothetical protein
MPEHFDAGGAITEWYVSASGRDNGSSIKIISTVFLGLRCTRVWYDSAGVAADARLFALGPVDFLL